MVVGRVPFQSKAFMTVLAKHIQEKPMPPREAAPESEITAAQEAVILRCLAKKPEERYQSAEELAAALRAADGGGAKQGRTAIYGTIGVAVVAAIVIGLVLAGRTPPEPTPEPTPEPVAEVKPVVEPVVAKDPPPVVEPPVVDPPPVVPDPPPVVPDPPTKGKTIKPKTDKKADAKPKDALTAAELKTGFKGASAAVKGCQSLGGIAGTSVKVDVTIGASGLVESASAHKPVGGSPLGRCVEKAVKTGKFPALTKPQKITYPFEF